MKLNRKGTFLDFLCETLIVRGTISNYNKEVIISTEEGVVEFQMHVVWIAR